jgi:hypothetical protein
MLRCWCRCWFLFHVIWIAFQLINTPANLQCCRRLFFIEFFFHSTDERARVCIFLHHFIHSSHNYANFQFVKFCKIVIAQQNVKCAHYPIFGCWLHKRIIFQWVNFCSKHCGFRLCVAWIIWGWKRDWLVSGSWREGYHSVVGYLSQHENVENCL